MTAAPVTLLFTDLVDSTALLQRVGAEGGQRILHAHRQLLREALASHGGREVKWLGDGLLTTFASVAEAKRFKKVANATALIWRMLMVAERRFRRLDAPEQLAAVYDGRVFRDGKLVKEKQSLKAAA